MRTTEVCEPGFGTKRPDGPRHVGCCVTADLQIRRFLCGPPDPFRTVRDLGLVSPGCPGGSGSSESRSSVWLPAWLPGADPRPSAFRPDISSVGTGRSHSGSRPHDGPRAHSAIPRVLRDQGALHEYQLGKSVASPVPSRADPLTCGSVDALTGERPWLSAGAPLNTAMALDRRVANDGRRDRHQLRLPI
jgi:hypothetical protein